MSKYQVATAPVPSLAVEGYQSMPVSASKLTFHNYPLTWPLAIQSTSLAPAEENMYPQNIASNQNAELLLPKDQ